MYFIEMTLAVNHGNKLLFIVIVIVKHCIILTMADIAKGAAMKVKIFYFEVLFLFAIAAHYICA